MGIGRGSVKLQKQHLRSTISIYRGAACMQACDRDIVVGLQKLKAFAFQQEDEVRWCAADESLCATALEHVLLTCIENGISLGSFEAVHIIETLEAASDDLSCAPAHAVQNICHRLLQSAFMTLSLLLHTRRAPDVYMHMQSHQSIGYFNTFQVIAVT